MHKSEARTLSTSTGVPISAELSSALLAKIKANNWWQGSVIPICHLPKINDGYDDVEMWVITSQACNIYNPCFEKVPVFELVAAVKVGKCDPKNAKGDNPRLLHLEARSISNEIICLELNIQKRRWLKRSLLAEFPASTFHVQDVRQSGGPDLLNNRWLDNLTGWLGRSYTRVALPDQFNNSLKNSKIGECLEEKLTKHKKDLYGIYISLEADSETSWDGVLGEMPPPYLLNVVLVTEETGDPIVIKDQLLKQLFIDKIQDPDDISIKITRVELARRLNMRLIKEAIEAKSVAEFTLLEIKSLIRYSLVDHLSDSSMAAT